MLSLARKSWFACLLYVWLPCCGTTASSETKTDRPHAAQKPEPAPARVIFEPPGQSSVTVQVEVAERPEDRQRGLMFRKHLDADVGMLFIFDQSQQLTFWMHNTLVPLDMVFITADWSVLGVVENATPLTDSARQVAGQSQYVVEVNAGFARSHGLAAGTHVRYQPASL
jgi:uncharacterized membrane protein (UPF0127 family)